MISMMSMISNVFPEFYNCFVSSVLYFLDLHDLCEFFDFRDFVI